MISERSPISRPPAAGTAWREEALVRAAELETLAHSAAVAAHGDEARPLLESIWQYLDAARAAATHAGTRRPWQRVAALFRGGEVLRAAANLDAAEAAVLRLMPAGFVESQLPNLLTRVRFALPSDDPRRVAVEDISRRAGSKPLRAHDQAVLVSALHATNSALRRQLITVRSFRNVVWATTAIVAAIAVALAVLGALAPDALPICFTSGADVYCPTAARRLPSSAVADQLADEAANPWDIALVEGLGLVAAAVSAAAALRRVRGTATPYSIPIALGLSSFRPAPSLQCWACCSFEASFCRASIQSAPPHRSCPGRSSSASPSNSSPTSWTDVASPSSTEQTPATSGRARTLFRSRLR